MADRSTKEQKLVALMVGDHYFQIILPGTLVGLIVGFATQKYGNTTVPANT